MKKHFSTYKIVGFLQNRVIKLVNSKLKNGIIYQAPGFIKHIKKKHGDFLKYVPFIPDMITNPDYVGIHPGKPNSIEYVKIYDDNILLSLELYNDNKEEYLYVSSLYDISDAKLKNRINNGRLKKYI